MADHKRIINVTREFYTQLAEYLQPIERWYHEQARGLVLFSFDHESGENHELIFHPEVPQSTPQR